MMKIRYILVVAALMFLSGCAGLTDRFYGKPVITEEAIEALAELDRVNAGLASFKGIGKIRLWNENGAQISRLAFLGADGNKIRIQILGITNPADMIIAGNGERFYYVSNLDGRFIEKKTSDPDLEKIVSLPIRVSQVVALLSGRVPMADYRSASIENNPQGGRVLVLRKWGKIVQRTYFDTDNHVTKTEMLKSDGSPEYRAEFGKVKTVGAYRIPFLVTVANDDGNGFQLDIKRYWTDVAIKPAVFEPEPAFK